MAWAKKLEKPRSDARPSVSVQLKKAAHLPLRPFIGNCEIRSFSYSLRLMSALCHFGNAAKACFLVFHCWCLLSTTGNTR